jgi:hypothetical protein
MQQEELTMKTFRILVLASVALLVLNADGFGQRGGAISGGMRGAVIGGTFGGEGGAATGAKIGAVTGATRAAVNREDARRSDYMASSDYQSSPNSNFSDTPPEIIVVASSSESAPPSTPTPGGEATLKKDGNPIAGVTFPGTWKQKTGERYISAVSPDGTAWAALGIMEGIADKEGCIKNIKEKLDNTFTDVKCDDVQEGKRGAKYVTGTAKTKKNNVDVIFAAGVFETPKGNHVGAAFVVDKKMEDHYKDTIRSICETIHRSDDVIR